MAIPRPIPLLPPVIRATRGAGVSLVVSAKSGVLDAFTWSRYRGLRIPAEQAYAGPVNDSRGQSEPGSSSGSTAVITTARMGNSVEMSSRIRRYTITMAFRTACFVSMILVDGPFRWVLFAAAVVLPYIAVVVANQANQRGKSGQLNPVPPVDNLQITTGEQFEVIAGSTASETSERRDKRVA